MSLFYPDIAEASTSFGNQIHKFINGKVFYLFYLCSDDENSARSMKLRKEPKTPTHHVYKYGTSNCGIYGDFMSARNNLLFNVVPIYATHFDMPQILMDAFLKVADIRGWNVVPTNGCVRIPVGIKCDELISIVDNVVLYHTSSVSAETERQKNLTLLSIEQEKTQQLDKKIIIQQQKLALAGVETQNLDRKIKLAQIKRNKPLWARHRRYGGGGNNTETTETQSECSD